MDILVIVGSCLNENSSANLCHCAYIKGLIDAGNNVELLSMDEKDKPVDRNPRKQTIEFFDKEKVEERTYNAKGQPAIITLYNLVENPSSTKARPLAKIRAKVKSTIYTYDHQGRIASEEEIKTIQVPDPLRLGKKIDSTAKRRNVYTYTTKSTSPDLKFYEDDLLRMEVQNLSEDSYQETVYFENDFRVVALYDKGRKVNEIVYMGETEVSRRIYEDK